MMDIPLALESLVPAAEYGGSLTANTKAAYDALNWTDSRTKPTWSEIEAAASVAVVPELMAYLSLKRWNVQTGGVPIGGGAIVDSSIDSLTLIAGTIESLERGWTTAPVKFKAKTGWVELTLEQIHGIAAAISQHTQACFAVEESVSAAIQSIPPTITSKTDIDAAGWPSNT